MIPRVLIVDDVKDLRFLLRSNLEYHGFDVVGEAADSKTAEVLALAEFPDGIVIDLDMPGSDSIAAIRRIRKALPNVRLLAVSATPGHVDLAAAAVAAGADAFFDKAKGFSDLVRCLRDLFAQESTARGGGGPSESSGASAAP